MDIQAFIEVCQGFLENSHPLCELLEKKCKFYFDELCLKSFGDFKEKLVFAHIIISPYWSELFKVICDASGVAISIMKEKR